MLYLHIHSAELQLGKSHLSEPQLYFHHEFLHNLRLLPELEQKMRRCRVHLLVELDSKARYSHWQIHYHIQQQVLDKAVPLVLHMFLRKKKNITVQKDRQELQLMTLCILDFSSSVAWFSYYLSGLTNIIM